MPTVPRLDSQQVRQSNLPDTRIGVFQGADSYGGGQAMAQLGNTLTQAAGQYAQEARKQADDIAVTDAAVRLSQAKTDSLYGPDGLFQKRGKNAAESFQPLYDHLQKQADEIESTLTSDTQKAAFRRARMSAQDDYYSSGMKHTASEIQQYGAQTYTAAITSAQNEALANPYDTPKIGQSIAVQTENLNKLADMQGWSPEVRKQKQDEIVTKTHAGVIEQMLASGKDQIATEYYEANKDQIVGDKSQLIKALEIGSTRGESQRVADDIFKTSGSLAQGVEQIKALNLDPRVRDATISQLKENFSIQEISKRDTAEKTVMSGANLIDQGKGIKDIPPAQWANLTISQRSALENYAEHKLKGTEPSTDWSSYTTLKTMASSPATKDKFLQTDLFTSYRGKLSNAEFKEMVNLQASLRAGDEKADAKIDDFRTKNSIVEQYADTLGLAHGKKESEADNLRYNTFMSKVAAEQVAYKQQYGKEMPNAELEKTINQLTVKSIKGGWFSSDKFVFEAKNQEDLVGLQVSDVPPKDSESIRRVLKKRGVKFTEQDILDMYKRKLIGSN